MAVKTEGFEGLSAGSNIPFSSIHTGFLEPGSVNIYHCECESGLRLLDPIPNQDGVLIGDFTLNAGVSWDLGSNGVINDAGDLPGGSAYLVRNVASGG